MNLMAVNYQTKLFSLVTWVDDSMTLLQQPVSLHAQRSRNICVCFCSCDFRTFAMHFIQLIRWMSGRLTFCPRKRVPSDSTGSLVFDVTAGVAAVSLSLWLSLLTCLAMAGFALFTVTSFSLVFFYHNTKPNQCTNGQLSYHVHMHV